MINLDEIKDDLDKREEDRLLKLQKYRKLDFLDLFNIERYFSIPDDEEIHFNNAYKDLEKYLEECKDKRIKSIEWFNRGGEPSLKTNKFGLQWVKEDIEDYERKINIISKYLLNKKLEKELIQKDLNNKNKKI